MFTTLHMSPRWGFRVGFIMFAIHIPPRWGFYSNVGWVERFKLNLYQ